MRSAARRYVEFRFSSENNNKLITFFSYYDPARPPWFYSFSNRKIRVLDVATKEILTEDKNPFNFRFEVLIADFWMKREARLKRQRERRRRRKK